MLVHGDEGYFAVAAQAIRSVLRHSDFDVHIGFVGDAGRLPRAARVSLVPIDGQYGDMGRPYRFLAKFLALRDCLASGSHDFVILMDADAMLARGLSEATLRTHLGSAGLGMVEQTAVTGSGMDRAAFLQHFENHAAPVILQRPSGLSVEDFRYYNSGVVVAARSVWERLVPWAIDHVAQARGTHEIGEHMVADQDYFQVWANILEPENCTALPWYWNHCEHWDARFPHRGVLFAHFSNACRGPRFDTPARMRNLMRLHTVLLNTVAGKFMEARWIRARASAS
jgi:hypothetical protein